MRKVDADFYWVIINHHPNKIALNLEPYGSVLIMPPNTKFKIETNGFPMYSNKQLPSLEIELGNNYITIYLSFDSFSIFDDDGNLLKSYPESVLQGG